MHSILYTLTNGAISYPHAFSGKLFIPCRIRHWPCAKTEKDLMTVKGATHYFNDKKGMQEKIFKASEKWFRKFMKVSF